MMSQCKLCRGLTHHTVQKDTGHTHTQYIYIAPSPAPPVRTRRTASSTHPGYAFTACAGRILTTWCGSSCSTRRGVTA